MNIFNKDQKFTLMNKEICSNYSTSTSELELDSPNNLYTFPSFLSLII